MSSKNKPRRNQSNELVKECSVCFQDDPPEKHKPLKGRQKQMEIQRKKALQWLDCTICKLSFHRYCYDPSSCLLDSKNYKCDWCKIQSKGKVKKSCFVCLRDNGPLKYVAENKFIHVFCALTSEQVIFQNFKSLKFTLNQNYKPKQKNNKQPKCSYNQCKGGSDAVIKCYFKQCNFHRHINCMKADEKQLQNDIIFNCLNDTESSFRLKNSNFLYEKENIFSGLRFLKPSSKQIPLITCSVHNYKYIWCTECNVVGDANNLFQCTKCRRWSHNSCTIMKNKSQEAYVQCNSCIRNNKFLMRALFPELILNMVQFQSSPNLNTQNLRYMDCFAFKSSNQLYKNLLTQKNKIQFQKFLLYQFIEKQLLYGLIERHEQIANQKLLSTLKQKKFIQIMYYLKNQTLKRLGQISLNEVGELNEMFIVKTKRTTNSQKNKQLQYKQKQKALYNKLINIYLQSIKKNQIKELSVKFIQFSDKMRKQIIILKQREQELQQAKQDGVLNLSQIQQKILRKLGHKPSQIALDIRQLLSTVNKFKQKFSQSDFESTTQEEQQNLNENKNKSSKARPGESLNNQFLLVLIRCILSKDQNYPNQYISQKDIQQLLTNYRKILFASVYSSMQPITRKPVYMLSQKQQSIISFKSYHASTILSQQSRLKISSYFKSLLIHNKIKPSYQTKLQLSQRYDELIQNDKLGYQQIQQLKNNMVEHGLYVDRNSQCLVLEKRRLYYRAIKIKYLRIVRHQLNINKHQLPIHKHQFPINKQPLKQQQNQFKQQQNQQNTHQPTYQFKIVQKNKKDIIQNVKRLLQAHNKSIKLTNEQKSIFEYYLVKQQVFSSILKQQVSLGSKLQSIPVQRQMQNSVQHQMRISLQHQIQNKIQVQSSSIINSQIQCQVEHPYIIISDVKQMTTSQRIVRILSYWTLSEFPDFCKVINILYPLAQKRIRFKGKQQVAICNLIQSLGQRYSLTLDNGQKIRINSDDFTKFWKLVLYAELQNAYPRIQQVFITYDTWRKDLQRFNPIKLNLQDKFRNVQLLQAVQLKIFQAQSFQIDMKSQLEKLRTVRMWSILSSRYHKDFTKPVTMGSIQQFKQLMTKIHYPINKIHSQIVFLDVHSRQLNAKLTRYLQKPKYQQLQLYQQLLIIKNKMTYQQAQELRNQMEISRLDVSVELQELIQEIQDHKEIRKDLHAIIQNGNLNQMIQCKRQILQSSFRTDDLQQYCLLVRKIADINCRTISSTNASLPITINKKQFFRLLNTSNTGSVELAQKMPLLLKAYRDIQKAQNEMSSPRPKFQNMLPIDNKKLKAQLKQDPTQRASIQKLYSRAQKLRQTFKKYKSQGKQYQKYILLQKQLSHIPISYNQISKQVVRMKSQYDHLVDRFKILKKNINPKQVYQLFKRYKAVGIKSQFIEDIKKVVDQFDNCMEISDNHSQYVEFSHGCRQYDQLQSIMALNQVRKALFQQNYIAEIDNPSPNITKLNTLVVEGLHLLSLLKAKNDSSDRNKQLEKILKLNKKIMQTTSKRKSNHAGASGSSNSDDDENDQQLDSYDNQDLDQGSYDDDQYQDYGQEQEYQAQPQIYKQNFKRAQPGIVEIKDSDDQVELQLEVEPPTIRKLIQTNPIDGKPTVKEDNNIILEQSEKE